MLQLKNNTPLLAQVNVFPNQEAIDTLYVVAKTTISIGEKITFAEEPLALQLADEFFGEPDKSSLKYPSDFHIGKNATDIIMLGSACALDQQEVRYLDVDLQVGSLQKTVGVFGDRVWDRGYISSPEPFQTMRMRYEKAFGGTNYEENRVSEAELRNPVGTGFRGKKSREQMEGVALPNLEDPQHLIQTINDCPTPACFAGIARHWQPRVQWAGTYDDAWQETRAPYLPVDYSQKFMSCAHPDLVYPGYLEGGEPVVIRGMHPSGELHFNLPKILPKCSVLIGGGKQEARFFLETLILEPNLLNVSMVWRAAFACDKNVLKISEIHVDLQA